MEVTPLKIVNHAVTFRLRWVRALDKRQSVVSRASEDVEVTLQPGESRPLDSVPVVQPARRLSTAVPAEPKAVSLRVVADFPEFDRRLIGADVWLVERLPNGKEQSQLQSLRGLPNRPIAFYFDGVPTARSASTSSASWWPIPQQGGIEISRRDGQSGSRSRPGWLSVGPVVPIHAAA